MYYRNMKKPTEFLILCGYFGGCPIEFDPKNTRKPNTAYCETIYEKR